MTSAFRILIDRLWPRGISKERANLNMWAKDIAPSTELHEWFGHKPERLEEFSAWYVNELDHNPALPKFLKTLKAHPDTTLLYTAKDPSVNQAVVLQKYLSRRMLE